MPSGKEGSLKHRILTRPYGEKDSKHRSSAIHGSVVRYVKFCRSVLDVIKRDFVVHRSSSNNNAPTNFTKGSLIELYNGELRRVEDMRTEDFISSSSKNPDLQLAETTVVKITPRPSNVMITFSYNNAKVSKKYNIMMSIKGLHISFLLLIPQHILNKRLWFYSLCPNPIPINRIP